MKTTIDLPEKLVHRLKMRAASEKRTVRELAAEYLRQGLERGQKNSMQRAVIVTNPETGLPMVVGGHPAAPGEEMTPDRVAEILMAQDIERFREST
jgi:plasmid stability protein